MLHLYRGPQSLRLRVVGWLLCRRVRLLQCIINMLSISLTAHLGSQSGLLPAAAVENRERQWLQQLKEQPWAPFILQWRPTPGLERHLTAPTFFPPVCPACLPGSDPWPSIDLQEDNSSLHKGFKLLIPLDHCPFSWIHVPLCLSCVSLKSCDVYL